jgi:phosphatidylserine/phosphatidylglycerophosphate/cardiolipin synthase-like enzyme
MMNGIAILFNKPGRPFDLSALLDDSRTVQSYLLVASAWFTDTAVADAIIAAPAATKVLNAADLERASVDAYTRLHTYFQTQHPVTADPHSGIYTLGGADWRRDGMMHHKYVVVDPGIVWVGSYNLTTFARNNYETLVRIADLAVAAHFVAETTLLIHEASTAALHKRTS